MIKTCIAIIARWLPIKMTCLFIILTGHPITHLCAQTYDWTFSCGYNQSMGNIGKVTPPSAHSILSEANFRAESKISLLPVHQSHELAAFSAKPYFFSTIVPEGNFLITVKLVGGTTSGTQTIKAESRRLMVESLILQPGEEKTIQFVVNVKKPVIAVGDSVKLNLREIGKPEWDDRLTLEFSGGCVGLQEINIKKVNDRITLFLAGNSTVVNQPVDPFTAWGQMLPRFLKKEIAVANHAESGLSLGSFLAQNRLKKILSVIKPGDYLFIEFGHNDQKETDRQAGAYGSYTQRLKRYVDSIRAYKGIPVIVTSTARRKFNEQGKTVNTLGDYPDAARKVAQELQVQLIDLNALTTQMYDTWGVEISKKAFVHYPAHLFPGRDQVLEDNTHFNPYGAYEVAKCLLLGIKQSPLSLKNYIIDDFNFSPQHPDPVNILDWPMNYSKPITKPAGN